MILAQFLIEVNEANAFIVGCEKTREAMLIDAGACDPRFEDFLSQHNLKLTKILITHDHYDHTDGLAALLKRFDAQVFSYSGLVGGCPTAKLGHGDTLVLGETQGKIVHTPGHTPDGISLILPGMVFTGDALFSGSVGGTASEADAKLQIEHIRRYIFALPDDYEVHAGHGPSSRVGIERRYNPFFNPA